MLLRRPIFALLFALALAVVGIGGVSPAQGTVPAVLLADVHFDPFHDPRLVPELRTAPIERWSDILERGHGLGADADLAKLEVACRSPRLDSDWTLFRRALGAAHDAQPHPVFVTMGGDLLSHQFPCRFHHTLPGASDAELAAFSAKTVAFVAMELRLTFPGIPVYITLGNNDSGCADYRETTGSPFMKTALEAMLGAATQGAAADQASLLMAGSSPEGDYSIALPPPFRHARLIVLQDIFDASWYGPCGGGPYSRKQEKQQIGWLRAQLTAARAHGEPVWVMGHIPTGVDVYGSYAKYALHPKDLCSGEEHNLLADDALADTLLDFADIVRLGLFAHTHMDEFRVLRRPVGKNAAGEPLAGATVAIKIVPSLTNFYGNYPAFLVAAIDPATLVLKDWTTFVSPTEAGSNPPWKSSYSFAAAYHLPDFSATSAAALADAFTSDPDGKSPRSTFFRNHFYAGGFGLYALGLGQIWPAYACAVREHAADAFRACLCPGTAGK